MLSELTSQNPGHLSVINLSVESGSWSRNDHTGTAKMRIEAGLACGLLFALGSMTSDVMAQVYKCQVDGRTTYQETPCAGGKGQQMDVAPPSRTEPVGVGSDVHTVRPAGDLAGLYRQITAAEAEERRLRSEYDREVEALRVRAARMTTVEADREVRALNTRHQQRMQSARTQREIFRAELLRLCPKGAALNARSQRCN